MSVELHPLQMRAIVLGQVVTKAAQNLPQNTTATLFTVAGGNAIVTGLYGVVSTVIQTQTCNLSLGTAPTTGTAATTGIGDIVNISAAQVGVWLSAPVNAAEYMQISGPLIGAGLAGYTVNTNRPFIVAPGTITWTTDASNTGQITWYCTYAPLDAAAVIS